MKAGFTLGSFKWTNIIFSFSTLFILASHTYLSRWEKDIDPKDRLALNSVDMEHYREQLAFAGCSDEVFFKRAFENSKWKFNSSLDLINSNDVDICPYDRAIPTSKAAAGCGQMSVVSLGGVPGFPQLDELVVCSAGDSLVLLLYNNTQSPMTKVRIDIDFDPGLTYGGFAYSYNNNATVAPFNVTNPDSPVFSVSDIPAGGAVIAVIGVLADCNVNVDLGNTLNLDASVQYTYVENGTTYNCTETITEVGDYNSAVKIPVLNILSVSPSQLNLTRSNTPGCQTLTISQDGVNAYIDDFTFQIMGLSSQYNITSVQVNGITVPAANYTIAGGMLTMQITDNYFPANTQDNNDNRFDENERLTVRICYTVNGCVNGDQFLTYKAWYGCNDDICFDITQKEGSVAFKPNYGANVVATSSVVQYGGICGDNLIYNVGVRSANTNSIDGLWNDVIVKMKACLGGNLSVVGVTMNGVLLPSTVVSNIGQTLQVDLTQLTSDIDGAGTGIADLDGDGKFDDLPGGQTLSFQIEIEIGCSTGSLSCNALGCNINQVEVNGKRNCGQTFQQFANLPTPISFFYGETASTNNNMVIPGYGLPITENFVTMANVWKPFVEGYEFTYNFGANNVTPCPSGAGEIYAIATVTANGNRINHLRYEDGSATYMGAPVSGVTWQYDTVPTEGGGTDTISISIKIPAGDVANDGGTHSYYFNLEAEGKCFPDDYMNVSFQVVEECDACGGAEPCKIVRSCEAAATYVRWNGTNCPCYIRSYVEKMERTNYGFTDKTMTTRIDTSTIPDIDKTRFLPGDTMFVRNAYEILNAEQVKKGDRFWQFVFNTDAQRAAPVIPDVQHARFKGWYLKDVSTGITREIGIPTCMQQYTDAVRQGQWEYPHMRLWNFGAEGLCTGSIPGYGTCPTDPELNPNYPSNSVVDYGMTPLDNHGQYNDRPLFYIQWGVDQDECANQPAHYYNNCYEEFLAEFPFENGDIFYVEYEMPMMHNPDFNLQQLNGTSFSTQGNFYNYMSVFDGTPNCGSSTVATSCNSGTPYQGHLPGPVVVANNVEIDDCDVTVNYNFTIANPVPTSLAPGEPAWYANEYRPISAVEYLTPQFPRNMVYMGDGTIRMPDGSLVPIPNSNIDPAGGNATCVNFGGNFCCAAADPMELMSFRINDDDYNVLKTKNYVAGNNSPYETGNVCDDMTYIHMPNDPFPMLSVGGTNDCNWGMNFSLRVFCPEEVESTDFRLTYQFAERYLTDLHGVNSAAPCAGEVTSLRNLKESFAAGTGTWTFQPQAHQNIFPINPYAEFASRNGMADGITYMWQKINTHPDFSGPAVNPMRQGGTHITTPDNFLDNSLDFPPLITGDDDFKLLLADLAGVNETNIYTVCAGSPGDVGATHQNVVTSIEVPNAVQLIGVMNAATMANMTFTQATVTDTSKIYAVNLPDLPPGECVKIIIKTELLFCPAGDAPNPRICLNTTSGCIEPAKASVLLAAGAVACDAVVQCYEYIKEESEIQVEWFPNPTGEYGLCDEINMGVRIKNVKPALLLEIGTNWWFPNGLEFVPGSWKVSYPGGPNNTVASVSIPDPTEYSGVN